MDDERPPLPTDFQLNCSTLLPYAEPSMMVGGKIVTQQTGAQQCGGLLEYVRHLSLIEPLNPDQASDRWAYRCKRCGVLRVFRPREVVEATKPGRLAQ